MRRRSQVLTISLALAASGLVAVPAVQAQPSSQVSKVVKQSPPALTEDEISARERFGLTVDPAQVQEEKGTGKANRDDIGVLIGPAEQADMQRRNALGASIFKIDESQKSSANFAGAELDQRAGGALRIVLVNEPGDAEKAEILSLLPPDAKVTFEVGAENSKDTLDGTINQFNSDFDRLNNKEDLKIRSVSTNLRKGVLEFSLAADAPAKAERRLEELYGKKVVRFNRKGMAVDYQIIGRNFQSGNLHGGGLVYRVADGARCTTGFANGRRPTGSYYLFTAGHCGTSANTWRQGSGGSVIGSGGASNGSFGTSNCDCQAIGPIPTSMRSNATYINNNGVRALSMVGGNTSQDYFRGRNICFAGGVSIESRVNEDNPCGVMLEVSFPAAGPRPGSQLVNLIRTDIPGTQGGDSGGTYYDGTKFMGIHTGAYQGGTVFSRSTYLEAVTTVTPVND